ncbi:MAG: ABC transporter ATP-binding protein [Gemmatimonadetes bacterium]|nr:ABC transporter ATP-binding protein [Gemmatimonadota bacterium]MYH54245.1 ABC transporter ATP-binding protein [Gemmatimonadota bacterium]MYK66449.1 ABC transporter ATP-binding protein [Gemmatimonadota bacterium]
MVHLTDVTKYYGSKRALGPVSFEIEKGNTVGFLGLNGVGKTTLLRILACGLRPSSGTALVDGFNVLSDPHEVRKRVGYLPELPPVYRDMTVTDYLTFAGRIKGMTADEVARRMPEVQERTRIVEVRDVPTGHLSQGYRQRVGVAQAIIHEPELLILDEPTHDLDPVQIMEMRAMIRSLKDSHTILISSHILPEISRTCDRLLILNDGEIVASGSEEELGEKLFASRTLAVAVRLGADGDGDGAAAVEAARTAIARVAGVTGVQIPDSPDSAAGEAGAVTFRVEGDSDLRAEVCRALVESGHDVVSLNRAERGLERVFVGLVGKAGTWH